MKPQALVIPYDEFLAYQSRRRQWETPRRQASDSLPADPAVPGLDPTAAGREPASQPAPDVQAPPLPRSPDPSCMVSAEDGQSGPSAAMV